jgi:UDP-glucose 4-epimerase
MKKVLVTGGAGFIGSWVADTLIDNGFDVIVIDNLSSGFMKNINPKIKFYNADIRDNKISEIFEKEKPDFVFHLAAKINLRESVENPVESADVNIIGTLNLLMNCVRYNVKKFIFSSTGGAMYDENCKLPASENEKENPISPYGISKFAIEKYLEFFKKVYGIDYVSLRYSNVYGPRQNSKGEAGVIAIFIDNLLSGKQPVINGSGEQTRDYVYVKDVAKANLLALELSGIFNVGTGKETDVNEIFRNIKKILNSNINEIHGVWAEGDLMRSCLNSEKLIGKGWKIKYNLEEGLKETVDYFKEGNLSFSF